MAKAAITQTAIIKALKKYYGNVTKSAKSLRVTREYLSSKIKLSDKLKTARDEARNEIIDLAEENVFELVKRETGKRSAANSRWILQTLGKQRGYTERTEVTGEDGGAIEITLKRKVVK